MYFLSSKKSLFEIPKVFALAFFLAVMVGSILYMMRFFLFMQNPLFFASTPPKQILFILSSPKNERFLLKAHYDLEAYKKNITQLQKELASFGYESRLIKMEDLSNLPKNSTIIAVDLYAIDKEQFEKILTFLCQGGRLFFNYHFGYYTPTNTFIGPKRVETITSLKYIDHIENNSSTGTFIVPKLLSPLGIKDGAKRSDLIRYDPIPLYRSPSIPDAILSNWQISEPPYLQNRALDIREAGLMWHGRYGKGIWYYASFALSSFLEMKRTQKERYLKAPLEYLLTQMAVVPYPFLHTKKAIFISQDTEYKYDQLINFARLSHKYNIPTTLFCVASLAQKYPHITKEAASFPTVEIASHSYSHTSLEGMDKEGLFKETAYAKKVLQDISGQEVIGFRPPKEQIDKNAKKALIESGYRYAMERTKPNLLPFIDDNLTILPRHGTDDYIYLINLDWDKEQIYSHIIKETNFLTDINALYTLSIHTHLITYKPNIDIIQRYFRYLATRPDITPLNGRQLDSIARQKAHITLSARKGPDTILVTIVNDNPTSIENFFFRLYHPHQKIKRVYSEIIDTKASIVKKEDEYTDIKISRLHPKSTLTIIISLHSP